MAFSVQTVRDAVRDSLRQMYAGFQDVKAGATGAEAVAAEEASRTVRELLREVTGGYELSAAPSDAPADIIASGARSTTTNSADQVNAGVFGIVAVLNLTAFTTAASLTLKVQRKNADGTYSDIFTAPAAVTALGKYVYIVTSGVGAAGGQVDGTGNVGLPGDWRISVVHGNANSHTYAVGGQLLR